MPEAIEPDAADIAHDLINAVIAEYSSLIALAGPTDAARLRSERARYIAELQNLGTAGPDRLRTILAEYPSVLVMVRAGR
ncbi:hypothetical protein ACFXPX_41120 [Kitasatospora sp. NPDC059146]|uniref:hypothetical protein n=1 Tax=Kitasatospora sp. NPDC059146 TaxID=3346741 RepID=UPI0036C36B1E